MNDDIWPETGELARELMNFLNHYARETIGETASVALQFAARDGDGNLLGGVTGHVAHGVLSVQLLAISPGARRIGLGARLLATLENAAREKGATVSRVDTLEFEAPDFYQKMG